MNKIISKRHLLKSISWRIIGSIDTLIISWLLSGSISMGLTISTFEIFTKLFLYYFHERIWWNSKKINSKKRHIFKTFSWRCFGTLDTIIISLIVTGNPFLGFKISFIELFSKMILYYAHEKIWHKSKYGLNEEY